MLSINKINIPEPEDDILPCKLCGSTSNQSTVRIRDYCERCFTKQFIEPLKKEERNLNESLAILRNNTMVYLRELGEAKRAEQTYKLRLVRATKTLMCIKCRQFRTDSTVMLLDHESRCDVVSPLSKKSPTKPRTPKTSAPTTSDADEIFS